MSRYVSIDFILNETDEFGYENGVLHSISGNSAPTIDIVRCKECRYGEVCSNYYDDGFCSTGERGKLKTIYNDGVVTAKLVCE